MNLSKLISVARILIPAILLSMVMVGSAQIPTARIVVEAFSPQEIHDLGWNSRPSTGLTTVGMEELVYLSGHEMSDSTILSYNWSFLSVPPGSGLTGLDSSDTPLTTFVPDTTGQYVVQLSITTAGGSHDTTQTITSAKWNGLGIITDLIPNPSLSECSPCHTTDKVTPYVGTGHATMFTEAIDGLKSSHYNEGCIECHTVGFDTLAFNDGFDDRASALGWTWPDSLVIGNWDTIVANYPDLAKVSNIQCENCHGAASLHKQTVNPAFMDVSIDEGVCGRCHEEEPYHRRPTQWKNSAHNFDPYTAAHGAPTRASCGGCHSGSGFIERVDGSITFNSNEPGNVSCATCHDPHSAAQEHQVRVLDDVTLNNGVVISSGGFGKLCMNCHMSRRNAIEYVQTYHSHFGPHHSNQADMLAGTNAITFNIPYIPSSPHKNLNDACVTCHMSPTPGAGEPGHDRIGDHTFAMHDPVDDVDNVTVCQPCHGGITTFEDIMAQEDYDGNGVIGTTAEELQGLLDSVAVLLPPLGSTEVIVTPAYNSLQLATAYNYLFVEEDGSHGVHNYQFSINLLKLTREALNYGVLNAGQILDISDIPNDQGKQVRIMWERFGGDGIGPNPVQYYALWRRIDDLPVDGVEQKPIIISLTELPSDPTQINIESMLQMDGDMWDFVGSVPATGMMQYSTIAPTLFDSTASGGMHWSVFFISGHTAIPTIFASSQPDSGYSIDNLAPTAPTNLAGSVTVPDVLLSWDEPVDEDFNYFAVYRGTTPGFPTTTPLATTTVNSYLDQNVAPNTTYYYKITAFDFSGNESEHSNEINVTVTSIGDQSLNIPTEFVLEQNYPNPFNPNTQIRYGIPKEGEVTLVIYDMLGKHIRTLASGKSSIGYHTVVWDGKDQNGKAVGTGVYVYRLKGESVNITKKMLLLK